MQDDGKREDISELSYYGCGKRNSLREQSPMKVRELREC